MGVHECDLCSQWLRQVTHTKKKQQQKICLFSDHICDCWMWIVALFVASQWQKVCHVMCHTSCVLQTEAAKGNCLQTSHNSEPISAQLLNWHIQYLGFFPLGVDRLTIIHWSSRRAGINEWLSVLKSAQKSIAVTLGTVNWTVLNYFFFAYFTQRKPRLIFYLLQVF